MKTFFIFHFIYLLFMNESPIQRRFLFRLKVQNRHSLIIPRGKRQITCNTILASSSVKRCELSYTSLFFLVSFAYYLQPKQTKSNFFCNFFMKIVDIYCSKVTLATWCVCVYIYRQIDRQIDRERERDRTLLH